MWKFCKILWLNFIKCLKSLHHYFACAVTKHVIFLLHVKCVEIYYVSFVYLKIKIVVKFVVVLDLKESIL